ncbi:hypothetical protein B0H63DRAFT_47383 [Podospora didyma]|uniref:Heavy metal tolerance protein n=1 Tax=Podospora didyma TaxID=330526 RepID=A0AAE0P739_9PEZI|nr:hypothetical protein B0H63DRAFT_47383 [Podospora didyma]
MMADPYDDVEMARLASGLGMKPALTSLHYVYPMAVFFFYAISSAIAVCTLQTDKPHSRRRVIVWLLMFSILSYLAQLLNIVCRSIGRREVPSEQDTIISLLSCILVFGVELAGLTADSSNLVWHPYIGSFVMALVFEPILETLSILGRSPELLAFSELFDISTVAARYFAFIMALGFYSEGIWSAKREKGNDSERQSLLKMNGEANVEASETSATQTEGQSGYGSTTSGTSTSENATSENSSSDNSTSETSNAKKVESPWERRQRKASEQMEKRLREKGNYIKYAKSFLVFLPYVWPVNNRPLQTRIFLVGCCLLTMNFINFLVPRQLGIIVDSLNGVNGKNPWTGVAIFAGLKLIASEAGLSLLRQWLWVPVEFYSFEAISTAAYSHVLNLSSDFHDAKSSSDIMMAIQSGQSISNMLDSICFQAIPMLIDFNVAFIYLSITFGPYEGFITVATASIFLFIATRMISSLKTARRSEVSAYFEEHYVRQAGIQGWTTVTTFNQIGHEEQRYSTAVKNRVDKSKKVYLGYILAYAFQYLVLLSGLLAGAFLAVFQVTHSKVTPGDFTMLLTYWAQLVAPLTFFANLGKTLSRDLIQAEQLLEIMQTKPTIVNKEGALPLEFNGGHVRFDKVCFSYDNKKDILKDISFTATPGMTIAFVGATGAGKSTILKLLDRFYDVTSGSIQIDGQDIRDVDLFSLRGQIGVVPQAPILFDDTVMNNVRYAKLTATDEEVHEACKAASIHEQIMGFTDGYHTRVGERGLKLSGGELQRVAIARAILKRPAMVLLDEATSAVDTETEQKIQEALRTLCDGRTTFIVAHRLSTIMNADRIVVIMGGELVEQGSHEELIVAKGKYAELWSKQIFVKPKDKDGVEGDKTTATKEGQKAPTIVNDLSPEVTSSELAKVNSSEVLNTLSDSSSQAKNSPPSSSSSSSKSSSETSGSESQSRPSSIAGGHTNEV